MSESIAIESFSHEERVFPPPAEFAANAHIKSFDEYEQIYNQAAANPEEFWASVAENLHWFKKWDTVLEWNEPHAKWFVGGKINASYNCLDRHLETLAQKQSRDYLGRRTGRNTHVDLSAASSRSLQIRQCFKKTGIKTGDRVALYMPLVPELAIAMLACARIGATHTVIFGGFSADAIRDRVNDGECKLIVTADGGYRRGSEIKLKETVDEAVAQTPVGRKRRCFSNEPARKSICKPDAITGGTN